MWQTNSPNAGFPGIHYRCRAAMIMINNGGEFTGWEFQKLLTDFGIKDKPTTSRNTTGNAVCKRMHLQVSNHIRTKIHSQPPHTLTEAEAPADAELAAASHAVRTNISQVTGYLPGALAFHRDMFLNVPLVINLLKVQQRRQLSVDSNLESVNVQNAPRMTIALATLSLRNNMNGRSWVNVGTVLSPSLLFMSTEMLLSLRDGVSERLNIRRVKPYHSLNMRCVKPYHSPTVPPPANPTVPTQPVSARLHSRASPSS